MVGDLDWRGVPPTNMISKVLIVVPIEAAMHITSSPGWHLLRLASDGVVLRDSF